MVGSYIAWHYSKGFSFLGALCKSFFSYIYNFFSVNILISTLFSPLQRFSENKGSIFQMDQFFMSLLFNVLMRITGFIVKAILLSMALVSTVIAAVVSLCLYIGWIIGPLGALAAVCVGIIILI